MILVLLIAAAVAVVLPTSLTGRFSNLLQVLVPFQDGVNRLLQFDDDGGGDSEAHSREIQALRSTIESLASQNRRLHQDIETLQSVRRSGLGTEGRLIPARVVADDAAHWRRSRLILSGTRQGIDVHQGVLSREFTVDLAKSDGAANGMAVLAAEVLIGVVEQAGTHTSRVKLLSDPDMLMPVTLGRVEDQSFQPVDKAFLLMGAGGNRIEIREVHHKYIEDGSIRVGDIVLTRDDEPQLPPSVTIGVISKINRDADNGLLYNLEVESRVDLTDIRSVYVVDRTG